MHLLQTLELSEATWITVIICTVAMAFVILGPLRAILRKRLNKKYHKVFDYAVTTAEVWALKVLAANDIKPSSIEKLGKATEYAMSALGSHDPETIIRGIEGALGRSKLGDDLMKIITEKINPN